MNLRGAVKWSREWYFRISLQSINKERQFLTKNIYGHSNGPELVSPSLKSWLSCLTVRSVTHPEAVVDLILLLLLLDLEVDGVDVAVRLFALRGGGHASHLRGQRGLQGPGTNGRGQQTAAERLGQSWRIHGCKEDIRPAERTSTNAQEASLPFFSGWTSWRTTAERTRSQGCLKACLFYGWSKKAICMTVTT